MVRRAKKDSTTGKKVYVLRMDSHRLARGRTAKLVDVACKACGAKVLVYQKDGPGWLKRCYLDRILDPPEYETLQHRRRIRGPEDMPNLVCLKCGGLIGTPVRHKDSRLAYKLIRGSFIRKKSSSKSAEV